MLRVLADIFHQSFFWLLRRTEEPQRGRNCLRRRRSKPSSAWAGSVLISFGVVLMSCRVNFHVVRAALGSLSNNVFERRTSTGSGLFSFFDGGFAQIFSQIASITVKKLKNTNFISSRYVKRENTSLSVDVRRSVFCLQNLICPNFWHFQKKKVMTWLNHFSLGLILLIYLKNDHSNSMEKNRDIFFTANCTFC